MRRTWRYVRVMVWVSVALGASWWIMWPWSKFDAFNIGVGVGGAVILVLALILTEIGVLEIGPGWRARGWQDGGEKDDESI